MTWTFDFNNPLAVRPEYTGGKGSNLAQLTEGRFDVPQGFIVTAAAYREWIEGVDWWREAVRNLPKDNPAELAVAAEALRGRLQDLPMPEEVCAEIRSLVEAHPDNTAFAVRSSSTLEDMADAAFAGQHDTFLNCRGADAVLERGSDQSTIPFDHFGQHVVQRTENASALRAVRVGELFALFGMAT